MKRTERGRASGPVPPLCRAVIRCAREGKFAAPVKADARPPVFFDAFCGRGGRKGRAAGRHCARQAALRAASAPFAPIATFPAKFDIYAEGAHPCGCAPSAFLPCRGGGLPHRGGVFVSLSAEAAGILRPPRRNFYFTFLPRRQILTSFRLPKRPPFTSFSSSPWGRCLRRRRRGAAF